MWGNWTLDREARCLKLDNGDFQYWVGLTSMHASAQIIMQLTTKASVTVEDIGWLVQALNAIIAPQSTLCSSGLDKRIDDIDGFLTRALA